MYNVLQKCTAQWLWNTVTYLFPQPREMIDIQSDSIQTESHDQQFLYQFKGFLGSLCCSGRRAGAVVRALASHQCGPGSIPRLGVICGLSLLVIESGARFSKVPKTFGARKTICEPANRLFRNADLLTCFQGNKMQTDCKV